MDLIEYFPEQAAVINHGLDFVSSVQAYLEAETALDKYLTEHNCYIT